MTERLSRFVQESTHHDARALAARALSHASRRAVRRHSDADRELASQLDASRERVLSRHRYAEAAE